MVDPIEALLVHTKVLTGLVLLLNMTSLLSLWLLQRWLRYPERAVERVGGGGVGSVGAGGGGLRYRASARMVLVVLLAAVIVINGVAIYANTNLLAAADRVVMLFSS